MTQTMNNSDVAKYSVLLCDALYMDMKTRSIRMHEDARDNVEYHAQRIEQIKTEGVDEEFYLETGRKYYKLIHRSGKSRSVHCFINKTNGDVLKSASWNGPAKAVRYYLLDDNSRELCYSNCDAFGGYIKMIFKGSDGMQS